MSFSPDFLDELRARIPIETVVGRRIKLTKRGREFVGLSPFNSEKTPSFTVVPDKGFYHCFSSGEHGDIIDWVMKMEGLSFQETVERLAAEASLPVPTLKGQDQEKYSRQARVLEVLDSAAKWYHDQLFTGPAQAALAYLQARIQNFEAIKRFRLGYAPPDRAGLMRHMSEKGFETRDLIDAGLLKAGDDGRGPRAYFFNRIMFPIRDRRGRVIAFGGRALDSGAPAKYLNSPETQVFHKGRVVYNMDKARLHAQKGAQVIVVEGYMDVITLNEAGFPAAVAPLGTAVTEHQIQELWRLASEPVICLDGDRAGRQAGARLVSRVLPILQPAKSLRFAFMPDGEDPDSLIRNSGASAMGQILSRLQPLSDFLWHSELAATPLETPEQKAGLKQRLMDLVDTIHDPNVREVYRAYILELYKAHFVQRRAGKGQGFSNSGKGWGASKAPGHQANNAQDMKQALSSLKQRPEQIFLAALINHPDVLSLRAEEVAATSIKTPDLNRLRHTLVDWVGFTESLDRQTLTWHLSTLGFDKALTILLAPTIYQHALSAREDAEFEDALRLVDDLLARFSTLPTTRYSNLHP